MRAFLCYTEPGAPAVGLGKVNCKGAERVEGFTQVIPHGGDQYHGARDVARVAALDVEELLHAYVSPEPRFRNTESVLLYTVL